MNIERTLLEKFWRGECSKDEVRVILKWFNSIDAEIYFSDNVDYVWNQYKGGNIPQHLKEIAFNNISNKISGIHTKKSGVISVDKKSSLFYFFRIAAIFVFLIVAIGVIKFIIPGDNEVIEHPKAFEWVEKSTKFGQKLTVFLNDGSKVILNAGSSIRFLETHFDSSRHVYLQGEAFFEVARDDTKPFTVFTESIATTALGTSFNIRSYPQEPEIKIALVTGKVKVNSKEQNEIEHVLSKGEGLIFNKQTTINAKYKFDPFVVTAWKDGIIYFKDATNQLIFSELEKWYGVEIDVQKPLSQKLYTGEFNNLSLKEVLEGISYIKDFSFQIKNGKVTIK